MERPNENISKLYNVVSKKAIEAVNRDKATSLSDKTVKLIALTEELYKCLLL